MKIRMNFGTIKLVILAAVFAGVLAILGLDIAILAGAKGIIVNSVAIPVVSMIAALLVGVACGLLIFNSFYKFKEQGLMIVLGFFADKVAYDEVVMLKQNMETSELFLIVNDKSKAPVNTQIALRVNIAAVKTDEFLAEVRRHIPNITVEMFTQPKKKKKDK